MTRTCQEMCTKVVHKPRSVRRPFCLEYAERSLISRYKADFDTRNEALYGSRLPKVGYMGLGRFRLALLLLRALGVGAQSYSSFWASTVSRRDLGTYNFQASLDSLGYLSTTLRERVHVVSSQRVQVPNI